MPTPHHGFINVRLLSTLLASVSTGLVALGQSSTTSSSPVPAPVISGNIPVVVPAPATPPPNPTAARPYFDVFSWQSFIALNWPSQAGASPDTPNQPTNSSVFLKAPNGTPVVWMGYKTVDDLFGTGSQRPQPWSTGPNAAPTAAGVKPGMTAFNRITKGNSADNLKDTAQAFSFPLVDQNSAYVRYEVRYNQPFYNFVRGDDNVQSSWIYLLKNLVPKEPVSMPASTAPSTVGAIMMKASWRQMTPADVSANRYYIINAMVYDYTTNSYQQKSMGLVGLHIAQKVAGLPQWVWSTFEQVDNVPPDTGTPPAGVKLSFNNGSNTPATPGGWANRPPSQTPIPNPSPVQVTRLNPIPTTPAGSSTKDLNASYQKALKGTVWQYYQLVITQWPSDPTTYTTIENGGIYPAQSGGAFPANGAVNTTMETYFQSPTDAAGAGGNSCMSCHYRADQSDFSWGLNRRAH